MPFDFGDYDSNLIDVPPSTPTNTFRGLPLDRAAAPTGPIADNFGGNDLPGHGHVASGGFDWGTIIALAIEGAAAGALGRAPQGPAILMRQRKQAQQKQKDDEKMQLEKYGLSLKVFEEMEKVSKRISTPEEAAMAGETFSNMLRHMGVNYPKEEAANSLLNPQLIETTKRTFPEIERMNLTPAQIKQFAEKPELRQQLTKEFEKQWGEQAYQKLLSVKDQEIKGADGKPMKVADVKFDQLATDFADSKYLTDDQKMQLNQAGYKNIVSKSVAEAKLKDEPAQARADVREDRLIEESRKRDEKFEITEARRAKEMQDANDRFNKSQENMNRRNETAISNTAIRNESSMRKEFETQSKTFKDIGEGYGKIQASIKNPSPAGDLSMIFAYMKILDPISVVREGEQATAQNARAVPDTVRTLYNRVMSGEKLTPTQRQDFASRAGELYKTAEASHTQRVGEFRRVATSQGLNPENVVYEMGAPKGQGPAAGGLLRNTSKSGKPIVSRDGGQSWEYEAAGSPSPSEVEAAKKRLGITNDGWSIRPK